MAEKYCAEAQGIIVPRGMEFQILQVISPGETFSSCGTSRSAVGTGLAEVNLDTAARTKRVENALV